MKKSYFKCLFAVLALVLCSTNMQAQEADWSVIKNCNVVDYIFFDDVITLNMQAGDELKIALHSEGPEYQLAYYFDLSNLTLGQDLVLSSNSPYSWRGGQEEEESDMCDGLAYIAPSTATYRLEFKDTWQDIEYSGDHGQNWVFHGAGTTLCVTRKVSVPHPTDIEQVEAGKITPNPTIYNVLGQRVPAMQKGLHLVNGKKVLL